MLFYPQVHEVEFIWTTFHSVILACKEFFQSLISEKEKNKIGKEAQASGFKPNSFTVMKID